MPLGIEGGAQDQPMYYKLSDWGESIRIPLLRQLGLDGKWAVDPNLWDEHAAEGIAHSPDQLAYSVGIVGDGYTAEALWNATPGYKNAYSSAVAMIWALTHLSA